MRKIILALLSLFSLNFFISTNLYAAEKLRVVTAHRILEDWVKQVGKERVEVRSVHTGQQDIHFFEPRPSNIKMLSDADVLVIAGLDLDAWMPELVAASRNPRIQYGAPGSIDPSVGMKVIEKPTGKIDMRLGDVHPYGNPHVYFQKENVLRGIDNIAQGLSRQRPEWQKEFQANAAAYKKEVERKYEELTELLKPWRDTPIVTYHKSWEYFTAQFGLEIAGQLEPKPGIPPSPAHLSKLVETMKEKQVPLLLAEPYYPQGPVHSVASRTNTKVLRLPVFLGSRTGDRTYLEMLEKNVRLIAKTLEEKQR